MAKQKINNNNSNNIEAGHNSNSSTIQQQHKYVFLPSTGLEVAHGSARIPRWLRQTPYSVKISVLASDGIWKALTRTGSDRMLYTDLRSDVIYWSYGTLYDQMVYSDRLVPSTIRWNPLLLTCVPRRRTHTLRQSQRRSDDAFSSFVSGYGQESLTKCTANQLNITNPSSMVDVSKKWYYPKINLIMYDLPSSISLFTGYALNKN